MSSRNLITLQRTLKNLHQTSRCTTQMRRQSGWTKDNVVKSTFKPIEMPNCTLFDYVWQNLERWPERTMSVCATTGRGYTYEQGFKLSSAFAANLRRKFKIRDGDTVAVMLPNIPDFPLVAMGILGAGGIISTINPVYTAHEVQRQLQLSNAKLVVTLPELVNVIRDALKQAKLNLEIIAVRTNGESAPEGTILFNELSEDIHVDKSCLKEVRRSPDDICFLPYSSGTTGLPKGVVLTHKNIIANCEQINEPVVQCHNETTATHQDAVMSVLPFFHIYGATVIMFHKMTQGIKMVTLSKMMPELFLQAMEKHRTNLLFAAPPIVLLMTSHPASKKKTLDHLELIVNGAAPLAASDANKFLEKLQRKIDFRQGYGLTETSPTVSLSPKGTEYYGSVGVALPSTELKIVDGDLNTLGPNQTGELLIKGPQVMPGYKDNPKANSEVFTKDGWFRTGDLAFIDDKGFLTIADRLKELIKVKGFQVPPAELEAVLREHPAVSDAGVVGVPHPQKGETPKAFVVLKQGLNVPAEDIARFVNERVAPFKNIEDVKVLESIPKNPSGKIMRRLLKEQYC